MRVTGVRQPVRAVFEMMQADEMFPVDYLDGPRSAR